LQKKVTAKIVSRLSGSAHVFFSSNFPDRLTFFSVPTFSAHQKKPRSKLLEKFFSILGGAFSPKVRPFLHEKVPRKIAETMKTSPKNSQSFRRSEKSM
jgi:hypothetical protein